VEDTKRGRKFHRLNVIGGLLGGLVVALFCYGHSTNGLFFDFLRSLNYRLYGVSYLPYNHFCNNFNLNINPL
jgi:hypothetical protein